MDHDIRIRDLDPSEEPAYRRFIAPTMLLTVGTMLAVQGEHALAVIANAGVLLPTPVVGAIQFSSAIGFLLALLGIHTLIRARYRRHW